MGAENVAQIADHLGPLPIIVAAAVRVNGVTMSMPRPARHHDILKRLPGKMANAKPSDQGFITDAGVFVGRELALALATNAGQLLKPTQHKELFSEDLW